MRAKAAEPQAIVLAGLLLGRKVRGIRVLELHGLLKTKGGRPSLTLLGTLAAASLPKATPPPAMSSRFKLSASLLRAIDSARFTTAASRAAASAGLTGKNRTRLSNLLHAYQQTLRADESPHPRSSSLALRISDKIESLPGVELLASSVAAAALLIRSKPKNSSTGPPTGRRAHGPLGPMPFPH